MMEGPVCHNNINVKDNDDDIFIRTPFDNKIGPSVEDRKFVALMDAEFHKDTDGFWSAPLPFKESKPVIPNNYSQAWKRALILNTSLKKDHHKRQHFLAFMSKVLASGAAEVAPSDIPGECWYLPLFGVYNSKKPDQIRGVFDSSAVFQDVSLNSVLMSGPDLTNNLVGILMRFRENAIAISGDIQQMFYAFRVHEDHRDYLRFFWYEDNNFEKPLIQYRMKAHIFGKTPSPAVATYGLRKASSVGDDDVRKFVYNNFYVDDGLTSLATESEAINLMRKTQATLKNNGNIRCSILLDSKHTRITHEVLSTFMAEATAIFNARPLVPVSTDPEGPCVLSPAVLLTQKTVDSNEDFKNLIVSEVYNIQWKFVQSLAEKCWCRWKNEYLQSLQVRRKWKDTRDNIQVGDVVLLKDRDAHRNHWPTGLVERVFPSKDGLVRKLEVRVIKDGQSRIYVRPISEIIFLCHSI